MSPLRLNGSTSGYAELAASAAAGDVVLTIPNAAGTLDRLNRAGNILQVVSTTKTDTFSTTSTTLVDVTGLNVSITPSSTSNKILVLVDVSISQPSSLSCVYQLVRGTTEIAKGTSTATLQGTGMVAYDGTGNDGLIAPSTTFLDSPSSTSSLTYKVQIRTNNAAGAVSVNKRNSDTAFSAVSSITVMEVAA